MPDYIQMLSGLGEQEITCRGQPMVAPAVAPARDLFTNPTGRSASYSGPYSTPTSRWQLDQKVPPGINAIGAINIPFGPHENSANGELVFNSTGLALIWAASIFVAGAGAGYAIRGWRERRRSRRSRR